MKFINILSSFILVLLVISCSQFGDSFRLPGEKSKDIIYFELDNDYLAPESREYIELNHSSNDISNSYILIGKNTYGFEADLNNDMSLSFDEDGSLRKTREHPFLKDNFKKGRFDKEDKEDKEEGRDKENCSLIVVLSSINDTNMNIVKEIWEKYKEYCERIENYTAYHFDGTPYANIYEAYSCFGIYQIFQEE